MLLIVIAKKKNLYLIQHPFFFVEQIIQLWYGFIKKNI